MLKDLCKEIGERMNKTVDALQNDLKIIRTGRASPALVERLQVEYYGTMSPLNQMASISVPEPRLLTIRPWDASALPAIEKAILKSDLGLTPQNDGKLIRLAIPRLTEERRRELVKMVQRRLEESKIALRNIRRDAISDLREFEKEKLITEDDLHQGREQVQELVEKFSDKVEELGQRKEQEIMKV
ncbi:MAG: ribosome recycling factor [Anaerolineaceae bacterium 4572_32.1]|nr:MAG: ribosome recycling factor [Anaerolineaceae bacterium 4572_32.1]